MRFRQPIVCDFAPKLLAVVLILFCVHFNLRAEDSVIVGDLEYLLHGTTATVISLPDKSATEISIPASITADSKEYTVTEIGENAFAHCTKLTKLTLPGSLERIGAFAFSYCSGIPELTIPNSVTWIQAYAFNKCTGLKNVDFEDGESELAFEAGVFKESGLESVYLGRPYSYSGTAAEGAFTGLTTLKTIALGESVTSIGDYDFYGCADL